MPDLVYPCPKCGHAQRVAENLVQYFRSPGLFCTHRLEDGSVCGGNVDRRKADRRGAVVAKGLTVTAEDGALLREMGIRYDA